VVNKKEEVCASYFIGCDNVICNRTNHIAGHSESDAEVSAARTQDGRIDADQLAAYIYQGAAGISRIDRGVGLNEVFIVFDSETAAAGSADNTHRHSSAKTEGISDGECDITHFDLGGIRERQYRQMVGWDFHDGNVGAWIGSYNFAFHFPVIGEHDFNIRSTFDDVIVGQDISGGIHDDARSEAVFAAFPWNPELTHDIGPEKSFQKRVVQKWRFRGSLWRTDDPRRRDLED